MSQAINLSLKRSKLATSAAISPSCKRQKSQQFGLRVDTLRTVAEHDEYMRFVLGLIRDAC